jgi:helix-turn-helix protein
MDSPYATKSSATKPTAEYSSGSKDPRFRAHQAVIDSDAPANVRLLVFVLSHRANPKRDKGALQAWPGHERLAKETGLSVSTVKRAVKQAQALGWLRVSGCRGGRGVTNTYQLLVQTRSI